MNTNQQNTDFDEMVAGMVAFSTRANGKQTLSYQQAKEIVEQLSIQQLSECLEKFNQYLPLISSASRMDSFLNACMQSLKRSNSQHPLLANLETPKCHLQAQSELLSYPKCPHCAKCEPTQTMHNAMPQFEHLSVHQTKAAHHLLTQTLKSLSEILSNS